MKQFRNLFLIFSLTAAILSCDDNSLEKQRQQELELLDAYLENNYPDLQPTKTGLYYIETKEGTGDTIKVGDRIQIYYATWTIGYSKTGSIDSFLVDESVGFTKGFRYDPFEFIVGSGGAIEGLDEAVTYLRKGSEANLIIDSKLAYGQNGNGSVLPFETILMKVEVYKVFP